MLKNSSKKIEKNKKRKVVPLLGTIQDWHQSKRKPILISGIENGERLGDQMQSSLADNGSEMGGNE